MRTDIACGEMHAETMPKAMDGDVCIMRLILHDWDDKDSIAILSSIRHAMGTAKAKLLIIEVLNTGPEETPRQLHCVRLLRLDPRHLQQRSYKSLSSLSLSSTMCLNASHACTEKVCLHTDNNRG